MPKIVKSNRRNIINFFNKILNKNVSNIIFRGVEHLESITEYKFAVFKFILIYDNGHKEEMYLKIIKAGKVKESIFCYWSLLYEEYLKENKNKKNRIPVKTSIAQQMTNQNNSSIIIELNSNINYCAEINLIELEKFATENKILEKWGEDLEIKSEDILFIGRKKY